MKFLFAPVQGAAPPKEDLAYLPVTHPLGIRLVRIFPGSPSSKVKCELQLATVGPDKPSYVALSYCWGEAVQKTWITCNGQKLGITKNLCGAIRRFRRKDEIVTFWIDQICINQKDIEERNSQVQLMRRIYHGAQHVYVWLGEEADDSTSAIELIPRLTDAFKTSGHIYKECGPKNSGLPTWGGKEWKALSALLYRPWFGRMWIIQEVAIAANASLVCGQMVISWQAFFDFVDEMHDKNLWRGVLDGFNPKSSSLLRSRLDSISFIRKKYNENGTLTFLEGLWRSMYFEATDPRDKIYAMFGLCDKNILEYADYSKDVRMVYRDVALRLLFPSMYSSPESKLETLNAFQILNEAERTNKTLGLPSWVPEWTPPTYTSLWLQKYSRGYKAAGDTKFKISLTDDPDKVCILGKICDTVQVMSSIAPKSTVQRSGAAMKRKETKRKEIVEEGMIASLGYFSSWLMETNQIAANCQRYSHECWESAYSQTVIGNKAAHNKIEYKVNEEPNRPNDYRAHYWHLCQTLNILYPGGVVNGAPLKHLHPLVRSHTDGSRSYGLAYAEVAQGRRFFATTGGYMGLGAPHMQIGDSICVFLGGHVPWVVRRHGEDYILIGECYVQ